MNKVILDYSTYITDFHEYGTTGPIKNINKKDYKVPNDYKLFFSRRAYCPFCNQDATRVFHDLTSMTFGRDFFTTFTIWECDKCGWWEGFIHNIEEDDLMDEVNRYTEKTLIHSIIRTFNVEDKNLPVQTLLNVLEEEKNVLYHIDPYKLEELAQYVFSSFYNCEVKHVGKTGDGGIDLLIIDSDDPILVQVKRRERSNRVELVSTVRDFLGAMFIENSQRGIILSTAKRFSKGSVDVQQNLLNEKRLDYFELVDFEGFCSMLNVIKKDDIKPWKSAVEKFWHPRA